MNKRKKYGIIFTIIVFIVVFVIALMSSIEVNRVYEKINENTYVIKTVKQIQPFNYDNGVAIYIWFIGIFIISIFPVCGFCENKRKGYK
ncbi:hypothetical protein CVT91_03070 [Candidatus Atribacteria bacterium HGW-Atribacteria-1]|nr:MAG: hypothetical protein CVT91_03070 [Candidatus Atribacteria bacterium HGW-Atribacteria-1]